MAEADQAARESNVIDIKAAQKEENEKPSPSNIPPRVQRFFDANKHERLKWEYHGNASQFFREWPRAKWTRVSIFYLLRIIFHLMQRAASDGSHCQNADMYEVASTLEILDVRPPKSFHEHLLLCNNCDAVIPADRCNCGYKSRAASGIVVVGGERAEL